MSRDAGRQRNPSLPVQAPAVSAVSREPALPTPAPPWDQDSVSREMKTRYKSFPCRLPGTLGDCAALPVVPRAWSPSEPLLKCPVPWTRRQGGHLSSSPSEKVATAGGAHRPGVPVLDSEPPGRGGAAGGVLERRPRAAGRMALATRNRGRSTHRPPGVTGGERQLWPVERPRH